MKEQLKQRLEELRAEFESGRNMLADLEARKTELEKTLLRIGGAIQVLEEELAKCDNEVSAGERRKPDEPPADEDSP